MVCGPLHRARLQGASSAAGASEVGSHVLRRRRERADAGRLLCVVGEGKERPDKGLTKMRATMTAEPPRDELEELFDDLGELQELRAGVQKKVLAYDIKKAMQAKGITPSEMA